MSRQHFSPALDVDDIGRPANSLKVRLRRDRKLCTSRSASRLLCRVALQSSQHQVPWLLQDKSFVLHLVGTTLLSGTSWSIALFGSPRGHSLALGSPSGTNASVDASPRTLLALGLASHAGQPCSSLSGGTQGDLFRTFATSVRVVFLLVPPNRPRGARDLPGDGQLRQVRFGAALQQPPIICI